MFYLYTGKMEVEHSLLMQGAADGSEVKSSLDNFGFAVCGIEWPELEVKELTTRKWPGEHGEDAYIPPSGLKFAAYDVEASLCFKGLKHTANLLSGTADGIANWNVVGADKDNSRVELTRYNTNRNSVYAGYKGLGVLVGGKNVYSCKCAFSASGWSFAPERTYTLSFTLNSGGDISPKAEGETFAPQIQVFLSETGSWADMFTKHFSITQFKRGVTRIAVPLTTKTDTPSEGSNFKVCINFEYGALSNFSEGAAIEITDLKLEENTVANPEWSPAIADCTSGKFAKWTPAALAFKYFRDYLTGGGEFKIYSAYCGRGGQGAYAKKIEAEEVFGSNIDEVLPCTVVFRVTDPITDVKLIYVGD